MTLEIQGVDVKADSWVGPSNLYSHAIEEIYGTGNIKTKCGKRFAPTGVVVEDGDKHHVRRCAECVEKTKTAPLPAPEIPAIGAAAEKPARKPLDVAAVKAADGGESRVFMLATAGKANPSGRGRKATALHLVPGNDDTLCPRSKADGVTVTYVDADASAPGASLCTLCMRLAKGDDGWVSPDTGIRWFVTESARREWESRNSTAAPATVETPQAAETPQTVEIPQPAPEAAPVGSKCDVTGRARQRPIPGTVLDGRGRCPECASMARLTPEGFVGNHVVRAAPPIAHIGPAEKSRDELIQAERARRADNQERRSDACAGTGKPPVAGSEVTRQDHSLKAGPEFQGPRSGECSECGRIIAISREGGMRRHKPSGRTGSPESVPDRETLQRKQEIAAAAARMSEKRAKEAAKPSGIKCDVTGRMMVGPVDGTDADGINGQCPVCRTVTTLTGTGYIQSHYVGNVRPAPAKTLTEATVPPVATGKPHGAPAGAAEAVEKNLAEVRKGKVPMPTSSMTETVGMLDGVATLPRGKMGTAGVRFDSEITDTATVGGRYGYLTPDEYEIMISGPGGSSRKRRYWRRVKDNREFASRLAASKRLPRSGKSGNGGRAH